MEKRYTLHPFRFLTSLAILSMFCGKSFSQEFTAGINVDSPNPNAVLHLVSPNGNQGLLIPSLTTAQRNAMSLAAADNGMLVFDADAGLFYYWISPGWIPLLITETAQTLDLTGTDLTISGGNVVDLSSFLTTEGDPTVAASVKDGVDWSELTGIPADIADGDQGGGINTVAVDNTTITGDGNGVPLSVGTITTGQVTGLSTVATTGSFADLLAVPAGLADGDDVGLTTVATADIIDNNVTLAKLADGAANQVLVTDGTGNPTYINQTALPGGIASDLVAAGSVVADAEVDNNLTINGGTVDNTIIGGTTSAAGTFTNLTSTGTVTLGVNAIQTGEIQDNQVTLAKIADGAANQVLVTDGTGNPTYINQTALPGGIASDLVAAGSVVADAEVDNNLTIDGGTVDNTIIGGTTSAAGTFTNLTSTGAVTLGANAIQTGEIEDNQVTLAKIVDGGPNQVLVTDGTGNPTYINQTSLTGGIASDLVAAGSVVADAEVDNNLTIDGGAIDNTAIGATTRAAGNFTDLDANGNVTLGSDALDLVTVNGIVQGLTTNADIVFDETTNDATLAASDQSVDATIFTLPDFNGPTATLATTADLAGATTLQAAYDGGNTIVTNGVGGTFQVSGDQVIDLSTTNMMPNAISLSTNGGSTETIGVTNNMGLGTNAVDINAIAGGIDMDAQTGVTIDAITNDVDITGNTNVDITAVTGDVALLSTSLGVDITANEAAANAIAINSANAAGGIDIDAGTGGINATTTGGLSLNSNTDSNLSLTANDAVVRTLTIAAANTGAGTGDVNITADGNITLNPTGSSIINNLSLTSPDISTSIDDANGNELFTLIPTVSAVNQLDISNSATGNGPTIGTSGEINVDLNIQTAGTGDLNLNPGGGVRVAQGTQLSMATDNAENLSSDGTDLSVNSGSDIILNPTNNVNITQGRSLSLATDDAEALSSDGTNLTINSGADVLITSAGAGNTVINNALEVPEIHDANDNEVVIFGSTATAVNEITITNAATATSPVITSSSSTDTNVDLTFNTQGNGNINIDPGAGGSTNINNVNLVSPEITTSIDDVNGNEFFTLIPTVSAVNQLDIANATTGNGPTISTSGEINVDLNITTAGTGNVAIEAGTGGVAIEGDQPSSFNVTGNNLALSTTTTGNVALTSAGDITLDGTTLSLDATTNSNFSLTGNSAVVETLTVSATNTGAGTGNVDITADGNININPTGMTNISNVNLISPDVSTSIDDLNGDELFSLTPSATPANQLRISNADAGFGPVISTEGDDTDVSLLINTKAAGNIILEPGTGNVGVATNAPVNPFQVGPSMGFFHFVNNTEGRDGEIIVNNLRLDDSSPTENELIRLDGGPSVFSLYEDNEINFIRVIPGTGGMPVDLTTEIRSWLTLNPDGDAEFSGAVRFDQVNGTPVAGMIRYDGSNLQGFESGSWQNLIGNIFQMGFAENTTSAAFGANTVVAAPVSRIVQVIDDNNNSGGAFLAAATFSSDLTANRSALSLVGSRGTPMTNGAVLGNDILGEIIFNGDNGTALEQGAFIRGQAAENWGAGNGSNIVFGTTPNGTNTALTGMILTESANVGIGTLTPASNIHIYNVLNQAKVFTVDAQGTQSDQIAGIALNTLGDGTANVADASTNGWFISAFGDAFSNPTDQNQLSFSYFNGGTETSNILRFDVNGNIGLRTSSPQVSLDINTTDAIRLPVGTTGERPANAPGRIRFNTTLGTFEGNDGTNWLDLASGFAIPSVGDANNLFFGSATSVLTSTSPNTQLGIVAPTGVAQVSSSSFGFPGLMEMRRANGSQGGEAALAINEVLGEVSFVGYNGTVYGQSAAIEAVTTQGWAAGNQGTAFSFQTTPNASTTLTEIMRLGEGTLSLINENGSGVLEAFSFQGLPSSLNLVMANGTPGTPTATGDTEVIGELVFTGNFGGLTDFNPGATIGAVATQNWALNTTGAELVFNTTPNGTDTPLPRMFIEQDGNIFMAGTGALIVHNGTTGERPAVLAPGMLRFNSTLGTFEGNTDGLASGWVDLAAGITLPFSGGGTDTTNPIFEITNTLQGPAGGFINRNNISAPALVVGNDFGGTGASGGGIAFSAEDLAGDLRSIGRIRAEVNDDAVASFSGDLVFETTNAGVLSPHMRLSQSGTLTLGTLFNFFTQGPNRAIGKNVTELGEYETSAQGSVLLLGDESMGFFALPAGTAGNPISITGNTTRMNLSGSGLVVNGDAPTAGVSLDVRSNNTVTQDLLIFDGGGNTNSDASLGFRSLNGGTRHFTMGIDADDNQNFIVSESTQLGTTNRFVIEAGTGEVGINNASPATALDVGGSVTANDYLLTSALTKHYGITPGEFNLTFKVNTDNELVVNNGTQVLVSSAGEINGAQLIAPVHLPDGATITDIQVFAGNNSVGNTATVTFIAKSYSTAATPSGTVVIPANAAAISTYDLVGEEGLVINNLNNNYFLLVDLPTNAVRLTGARVEYTIASAAN